MIRRLYHCTCIQYNSKKQGYKLCKLLNPKQNKRWHPVELLEANALPSIKSLTKTEKEPGKRGTRRLAMLNKLFMKNITDIMSTGTVSMQVVGRGIEISKVKLAPNFQTLNVFWVCKGSSTDEETEKVLNSIAGPLRHELSTLRLMGEVPYVMFLKDRQEALLVDIDRRLGEADYGDDYTPTEIGHILKAEFTLNTKLSPEMKAKIKQLEDEEHIEDPIPEMTHNVFGLEHEKILSRLLAARKKSKDAWNCLKTEDSTVISYRTIDVKVPDKAIDTGKQKKELAEFLLKRQILHKKLLKESRNTRTTVNEIYDEEDEVVEEEYDYEENEEFDNFYEQELKSRENEG